MTPAEIQNSVARLAGNRSQLLASVQARRDRIGAGVVAADWDPARMDDFTLAALVGFGLLALWQWTDNQASPFTDVTEPLRFFDGGSPAPVPGPPGPGPSPPAPVPQPPTQGGDQVDPATLSVVGGSPDFRGWPITTQLAITALDPAIVPSFGDPGWPDVFPPGFADPIQYTVCAFALNLPGRPGAGFIQMWRGRPDCGDEPAGFSVRDQLCRNWWYYVPELAGYLPAPGDQIAFCVASGNLRGGEGPWSVQQRSNLVVVTL